jgi:histidine triad (HIT) family protein
MPMIQGMVGALSVRPLLPPVFGWYPTLAAASGKPWFVQETARAMLKENIFQKIIDRQIKADIVYEDDRCLAFRDTNPQAPVHVLIIPRKVIPTHDDVKEEDRELLGHLHVVAARLAKQLGLHDGYRLVLNCREKAGQTVPHLHLHLLGGRDMHWPPG